MKTGRNLTVVLLAMALVPVLYVIAYLCMVRVVTYDFGDQIRSRYLFGGDAAEAFLRRSMPAMSGCGREHGTKRAPVMEFSGSSAACPPLTVATFAAPARYL
jgi:hypothetical protein